MNQCPVCSSEIQDSFGLIECPSCHKFLFADFDGKLKVHEENPSTESVELEGLEVLSVPVDANFSDDWNAQAEDIPPLDVLDPVVDPSENSKVIIRETPSAIDEINAFAKSEESSLKNGALMYDLMVKNVDTEDLKQEILEVLKEPRLNIDIKKLKFSLPTLELKGLNPIKVSVIISKIKHLPVDLEWVQRSVISGDESNVE